MTTKQAAHHAKLRAEGWTTIQVWLSPADQARLKTLAQAHGSATAAIRALLVAEVPS